MIPKHIQDAIKCGHVPKLRDWQNIPIEKLTEGEKVLRFASDNLVFPEGKMVGKPLILDVFQQVFILSVFDSPDHVAKSLLSMARRNGKTLLMSVICMAYLVGPMARTNTLIRSAAMTREQAGIMYRFMNLICEMSPALVGKYHSTESTKKIVGLAKNVEYRALSRDAKSGHGLGIYILVLDEAGQIEAAVDDYLEVLFSSMGTYDDSRTFVISTQAKNSTAYFSIELDSAARDQPKDVVSHLYAAEDNDMLSKKNQLAANPGLRAGYRSKADLDRQIASAISMPSKANGVLNLNFNRRTSRISAWLSPEIWADNAKVPDPSVFLENGVHIGLDLSQKHDLTVAVVSAMDSDGVVHCVPHAFTPEVGIHERSNRDRTPYEEWANSGVLIAVPGKTISYPWVAEYLKREIEDKGIVINSIEFDRWRINEFMQAADSKGFAQAAEWNSVGQGYQSLSPRIETMETSLLESKIRHGNHPVLNLGASTAITTSDPAGNRKLDKVKSSHKIDGIVAMVMSIYPLLGLTKPEFDVAALIG